MKHGIIYFRLPISTLDEMILESLDTWQNTLGRLGMSVSTGPIVGFRALSRLRMGGTLGEQHVHPFLTIHNVRLGEVTWPVNSGKPQTVLARAGEAETSLIPKGDYCLVRRFSAKEEPRRLICAPLLQQDFATPWIGLENHLNYIYGRGRALAATEAVGVSAILNSALLDRRFRIQNGNTQVNAAELRSMPLPSARIIQEIGDAIITNGAHGRAANAIAFDVLRRHGAIGADFPTFWETRDTMSIIDDAQAILFNLGLPNAQRNEMAALVLLVLGGMEEGRAWSAVERKALRIHDMLAAMGSDFGRDFAENTRETVRKNVLHQFEQAGLVVRNPDDPNLATNSPLTHYALTPVALSTVAAYGSEGWAEAISSYAKEKGRLTETYRVPRDMKRIPVELSSGAELVLSPGEHNELQAQVVTEFAERFAPGATLLYVGDTENKLLFVDEAGFLALGLNVPAKDALPDIVLYHPERNWIYLIEAVTSHGPISPTRLVQLREALLGTPARLVFITAFLDFATYKKFAADIAWETEVWLAEMPDHLIHYNGDRFLSTQDQLGS